MNIIYKFHFLNGISEINQLFDDILIIWPAPVCVYIYIYILCVYMYVYIIYSQTKNWDIFFYIFDIFLLVGAGHYSSFM